MGQDHVNILNILDVITGNNDTFLHQIFEPPSLESSKSNGNRPPFIGQLDSIQDAGRYSSPTDTDHDIPLIEEILELSGEDIIKAGVISPGGHQGDIIRQWDDSKAFSPRIDDGLG